MNLNKKIININNLVKKIKNFHKNKKIGLCHGVFDLLHLGHIKHFEEAKKNCNILIVSVTEDKFVAKGPGRPAFNDQQRMEALASLEYVDYVVLSNQPSSVEVINKIKPNIYFKGPDYKNTQLDITQKILLENRAVIKNKGKIFITKSKKYSSSLLLNSFMGILTEEQKDLAKKIKQKFNFEKIKKIINDFKNITPLIIGETIIDQYFFCEALGKSGKEPILVLRDKYNESYLGGAGAICRHISEFCKNIFFLSTIGEKKESFNFIKKNLSKNIKYYFLRKKDSPTIIKKRFLDDVTKSKLLGVYSLEDSFVNKIEEKNLINNFNKFLKKSDLTILSDYGHGMISKDFSKIIKKKSKFLAVNVQINAANIGYHSLQNYKSVDFMIINEGELRHEMRSKNENIFNLAKELANNFKIKYLVVTQGSCGSFLYEKNKNTFYKSGAFAKIALDKVGAGDAMLSILAICLYKKIDINLALLISSLAAAQSVRTMGNKFSISKNTLLKELEHFLS
jgi:rfaE bifunctional protein kinase chain/domain/rfaE bifunctional protein nucleotidyltransferase chain/domain